MSSSTNYKPESKQLSRRTFMQIGTVAAAGSALSGIGPQKATAQSEEKETDKIVRHRKLGRTGFKVSDISMGCIRVREPNVIRYAYDKRQTEEARHA